MTYTDADYDNDNRDEHGNCIHCGYGAGHSDDCQMADWSDVADL